MRIVGFLLSLLLAFVPAFGFISWTQLNASFPPEKSECGEMLALQWELAVADTKAKRKAVWKRMKAHRKHCCVCKKR